MNSLQLISLGVVHGGAGHRVTEAQNGWAQRGSPEIGCSKPTTTETPATARSPGKHPGKLGLKISEEENSTVQSSWQEKCFFFTLYLNCFLYFHLRPSSFVLLLHTNWSISFPQSSGIYTPWKDPSQRQIKSNQSQLSQPFFTERYSNPYSPLRPLSQCYCDLLWQHFHHGCSDFLCSWCLQF